MTSHRPSFGGSGVYLVMSRFNLLAGTEGGLGCRTEPVLHAGVT
jgi:hypothetical protein